MELRRLHMQRGRFAIPLFSSTKGAGTQVNQSIAANGVSIPLNQFALS